MGPLAFVTDVGTALLLGVLIGAERQWRQHPAGMRTNALVALGAALFVYLPRLAMTAEGPSRVAAQVVSGIGFLGGGVILREGLTVRGMTTAATIWCSAAIGALSGVGFPLHAAFGAAAVLGTHLLLRPVVQWIDTHQKGATEVETQYKLTVVAEDAYTPAIRSRILAAVNAHPRMVVHGLATQGCGQPGRSAVVVDVFSAVRDDRAMEELTGRLGCEAEVSSAGWERLR
jgi:putative Mg2+ transporter-C (MgtC) family protein